MDISKQFQEHVKKKKSTTNINSNINKQQQLQKQLFKDNKSKINKKDNDNENENDNETVLSDSDILKASSSIFENIESLKEFLNDNREAYIDTTKHVSSRSAKMTDDDRDTIDNVSSRQIEICRKSIEKLDHYIRKNFITNPKYRRFETIDQVTPSLLRDDPDSEKFYSELELFDNKVYMYMSIIDQLRILLTQVTGNFKKQRDFRLASIKENQRFTSSLRDRSQYTRYSRSSNNNSNSSSNDNNNNDSNLAELLDQDKNRQVYKEVELDNDEQLIFEQQNASLINELESLSDQILVIERQIEELSKLFDEVTPHIMAQRETIDTIYSTNVQSTNYIQRANQHIQDATKKTFDFRVMVLIILITASFVLLFLNWNRFDPSSYIPAEFDIPNYTNLLIPIYFIALLSEVFISAWRVLYLNKQSYHDFNNTISSILLGSLQELFHYFLNPLFFIPYLFVWNNFRIISLDSSSILSFIISFIGIDFSVYSFHRLGHEINFFWAIHVPHHTSEYYNFSSATRQGVFQYIMVWLHYLPLAFVVHPIHYSFHHHWNRIFQFWLHTDMFPRIGFLEKIFVTPSLHKVHHASNNEYIDKNYGGVLIIWDKLFGTFMEEDENIDIRYGITEDVSSYSTIYLNAHHGIHMYNLSKKLNGISKLKVLWKSPNWKPEDDIVIEKNEEEEIDTLNTTKTKINTFICNSFKKEIKYNDVFGLMLCIYLVVEISSLSTSLSTLELFKHTFTDFDLATMTFIMVLQLWSVSLLLCKNYNHDIQISPDKSSNQSNNCKSFFRYYPKHCTLQTIRIILSAYLFYIILQNHKNINSTGNSDETAEFIQFYSNLIYLTIFQLFLWILSITFSNLPSLFIKIKNEQYLSISQQSEDHHQPSKVIIDDFSNSNSFFSQLPTHQRHAKFIDE